jgi:hypothetical protein
MIFLQVEWVISLPFWPVFLLFPRNSVTSMTYACYSFLSPKVGPLVMASITPASSSLLELTDVFCRVALLLFIMNAKWFAVRVGVPRNV